MVFRRWFEDSSGATAIEYALLAFGIGLMVVAAVFLMGNDLGNLFNTIGDRAADVAARDSEL
ncbi:MAG: Flp family type IVb pilin [Alphaproteobacteria bacterium]|nr:Flp family type IVb pilin [Alphaproteobacteria bacterium]